MQENNTQNTVPPVWQPPQPLPAGVGEARPVQSASTVYGTPTARPYPKPKVKHKEPYTATRADAFFVFASLLLGVLFYRTMWFLREWRGWGVTLFTLCFAAALLLYAWAKKIRPAKQSWYWLGVLALTGISYALWPSGSLLYVRSLFLFAVAIYWCGCLFGVQLQGKTGNFLPLDMLNLTVFVPVRNGLLLLHSLKGLPSGKKQQEGKSGAAVLYAVLGVLLCIPVFAIVLPMLLAADGGGFANLTQNFTDFFFRWLRNLRLLDMWQYIFGFITALYLCGLVAGSAHKRYTSRFDVKKLQSQMLAARVLPKVTAVVVLGAVSLLYVVFVACQLPYYFSAFNGVLPGEFATYSDYARQGFFELCRIAAINLALLAVVNTLSAAKPAECAPLRIANLVMTGITLVLITTAFSKMAMYISAYGLTPKRILTSVFMVFMACVWAAVGVLQFQQFSIVRFAAVLGSAMFCALCVCNMDGIITSYNAQRYVDGTIDRFENVLLQDIGIGSVDAMLQVYEHTEDEEEQETLMRIINRHRKIAAATEHTKHDTLLQANIRGKQYPEEFGPGYEDVVLYWWDMQWVYN